jgi:hypothetical protein
MMQDRPLPKQLLESVSSCLREEILPVLGPRQSYRLRIVINALTVVARQLDYAAGAGDTDEIQRLKQLLGATDNKSLDELTAALCDRIGSDEMKDHDALIQHLWLTTMAKIEVDQPEYAGYRKAIELWKLRAG